MYLLKNGLAADFHVGVYQMEANGYTHSIPARRTGRDVSLQFKIILSCKSAWYPDSDLTVSQKNAETEVCSHNRRGYNCQLRFYKQTQCPVANRFDCPSAHRCGKRWIALCTGYVQMKNFVPKHAVKLDYFRSKIRIWSKIMYSPEFFIFAQNWKPATLKSFFIFDQKLKFDRKSCTHLSFFIFDCHRK